MYAQKDYLQKQGDSPYSIAQKGSHLVATCNLLARFDKLVDPASLNKLLTRRGIYLPDADGYNDELGWHSVTAYDGTIQCEKIGGPEEWPTTNRAIMGFADGSYHLVDDPSAQTIIDSWDGTVRYANTLGPHTGWATYGTVTPLPVSLNSNATQPNPSPVTRTEQPDTNVSFEILDEPRQMYVIKEGGANKWAFGNIKKIEDLVPNGKTSEHENVIIVGIAKVDLGEDQAGFYMDALAWGDYATTGHVKNTIGYAWADLSEGIYVPPEVLIPEPAPEPDPTPTLPPPMPENLANPNGYKSTYREFEESEVFRITESMIAQEYDSGAERQLTKGKKYEIAGVFMFDGQQLGRPAETYKWWGIPMKYLKPVEEFIPLQLTPEEKLAEHRKLSIEEKVEILKVRSTVQLKRFKAYKQRYFPKEK